MQWYYSENGMQRGPVTQEELQDMISEGRLGRHELVWREGMAQWRAFAELEEFQKTGSASVSGVPPLPVTAPLSSPPLPASGYGGSAYPPAGTAIPSYLWQSIVLTLLCCMPVGIVAIVFASKVDSLAARGDIDGAMAASRSAKTWCLIALGLGLLSVVAWLVAGFFFGTPVHVSPAGGGPSL